MPKITGNLLDFRLPKALPDPDRKPIRGNRRASLSFSPRSARSLAILLASLQTCTPLFLTLTLSHCSNIRQLKEENLRALFARIKRRHPLASIIWRLEKQSNGSPHFHFLAFGLTIQQGWEILNDWRDLAPSYASPSGQDIQQINTITGAYLYVVGHGTKKNQTFAGQEVGRYWGVHNRSCLPFAPTLNRELTKKEMGFLDLCWQVFEIRRCRWIQQKYSKTIEPRDFLQGTTSFFPLPVLELLALQKDFEKKEKKDLQSLEECLITLINPTEACGDQPNQP